MNKKILVNIKDIEWDTDWEEVDLPESDSLELSLADLIEEWNSQKEIDEAIKMSKWWNDNNIFDEFVAEEIDRYLDRKYWYCFLGMKYSTIIDNITP